MGGPDSGYLNRSGSIGSQRSSSLKLNAKEVAKTLGGAASVAPGKKHDGSKSVWLEAWNDPIAGLKAYQPCVGLCDLFADGEWRLVVADMDRRLKVWKGTQLESDNGLLERASALQCFYMEHTPTAGAGGRGAVGRVPSLAVAAGAHVYVYRNLRPYYKHTLSCEQVSQAEAAVWGTLAAEAITSKDAEVQMQQMLASGATLSQRAMAFLDVTDEEARASLGHHTATQMAEEDGSVPPQTVVTCLAVLRLGLDEAEAAGCLVLGTESGRVLILDQKGATVRQGFWVGAAPAFLATSGTLDVNYFIAIATRDNHVHLIRQGVLTRNALELEAPAVGLLANPAALTVACMNSVVHSFSPAGQREACLFMPAPVVAMTELIRSRTTSRHLVLALANMQVRVYSEKTMVSLHTVPSPITAIVAGRYGREDHTLISILKNGTLDIKILPRNTAFPTPDGQEQAPPEQEVPLDVPKKTKLYVELTRHEREQAVDMHRQFQQGLCKLRLTSAASYVKVLTDGQGPVSMTAGSAMRLHMTVHGLGPLFKLVLQVMNTSAKPFRQVPVLMVLNEAVYTCRPKQMILPLLVPGVSYDFEVDVSCIDPASGQADAVRVVFINPASSLPLLSALVNMPVSETDEGL